MKTLFIITVIIFLYPMGILNAQGLFITTKYTDCDTLHKSANEVAVFEQWLEPAIIKEFPCLNVLSDTDEKALLSYSRQANLLGNNATSEDIMEGLKTERMFVVQLSVARLPAVYVFKAICVSSKQKGSISYDVQTFPVKSLETEIFKVIKSMTEKLVKNLAYAEPCAYKGDIKVNAEEQSTSKDSLITLTKCEGHIGERYKRSRYSEETNVEWKLYKQSRIEATGTVVWQITSAGTNIDSTECYPCKSGKFGYRRSELTTESVFKGSGVPKDVRVETKDYFRLSTTLKFNEDSTFYLTLHGSAGFVDADVTQNETITGCDKNDKRYISSSSKSVYISVTLGPFTGSPMDKDLHAEGVQDVKNSINSSGRFKYNFTLKRK